MLAVPAEQLVRAHAGQDHLDPARPRRLAHQQRVDGGRVADRLVQRVHHARQQVDDVGRDLDLVQLHSELRRDLAGVKRVVRHGLQPLILWPEGDRVGVDLLDGAVREHCDDAGIQAAGQEAGHRHVGHQVGGDRLLDHLAQVRPCAPLGFPGHVRDLPVVLQVHTPIRAEAGPGTGGELAHALDRAELLGHPVIEHRGHQGARLDPQLGPDRRHQRLQLRGEQHAPAPPQVEQRLDAERVAREKQLAGLLVGQGEREHTAEPGQRRRSPVAPRLEHDLGVGGSDEADATAGQLGPQFLVVVELAVVDERQPALGQRLAGRGGQVDDREPSVARVGSRPGRPRGSTSRPRRDLCVRSVRS